MATDDLKARGPFWRSEDDQAIDRLTLRINNYTMTRSDWDAIEDEIARARREGAATLEAQLAEMTADRDAWRASAFLSENELFNGR